MAETFRQPTLEVFDIVTHERPGERDALPTYKLLARRALEYDAREKQIWRSIEEGTETTLIGVAEELATMGLVRTLNKANQAASYDKFALWADRFTEGSKELYGKPDQDEAIRLVREQQEWLSGYTTDDPETLREIADLQRFYASILEDVPESGIDNSGHNERERDQELFGDIRDYFVEKYRPIIDLIDVNRESGLDADEIASVFEVARELLSAEDEGWNNWTVVRKDGPIFGLMPDTKQIQVGTGLNPLYPLEARRLLIHELLFHGAQSVNGYNTDDDSLGTGLPFSHEILEGFATLIERPFVDGADLHPNIATHYRNAALALGTINDVPVSRDELFVINQKVRSLRSKEAGEEPDDFMANVQVNRIVKESRSDGEVHTQAIYTKDIFYHSGYARAKLYMRTMRDQGFTTEQILDYVMIGMFDPTRPEQTRRVKELTNVELVAAA